ncbi:MAG: hypothetical protein ACRC0I_07585 [Sediminibacterium sp.]|jgi:hypothetical protein|nr:hypothetical protein [Chitinophagaceae bacterium]MCA6445585.1 hypothetical protein [Chitinophagaceae bacterium]
MKKILFVALVLSCTIGYGQFHGGVAVGYGYRPYYYGGYAPYYGSYWWNPYYSYNFAAPIVRPAPSKLDREIATIEHDADQKIASVRMDHSLSRHERRANIRAIRAQEDLAIADAKRGYYKQ